MNDFRTSRTKYKAEQRRANRVPHGRKESPATITKQRREHAEREIDAARRKLLCTYGILTRTKDPIRFLADLEAKRAADFADAEKSTLAVIGNLPVDDL